MRSPKPPGLHAQPSPRRRDTRPGSWSLDSHPSSTEPGLHNPNAPSTAPDTPTMRDQRASRRHSHRSLDSKDELSVRSTVTPSPKPPCLQAQTSPSRRDTRPRSGSLDSHLSSTEPGLHNPNAPSTAPDTPTMRDQRASRRHSRKSFDGEGELSVIVTPPPTLLCPTPRKSDATDDKCFQPVYDPQSMEQNAHKSFDSKDELAAADFKCSPSTMHHPPPIAPYFEGEPKRRIESASYDSIGEYFGTAKEIDSSDDDCDSIGEDIGTAKEIDSSDDDSGRSSCILSPITVIDTKSLEDDPKLCSEAKHTVG